MPTFEKVILKEGKYRQWNDKKKDYEFSEVTSNRLRKLVDTFQLVHLSTGDILRYNIKKQKRRAKTWKQNFNSLKTVQ
jgi:hypothetical protein